MTPMLGLNIKIPHKLKETTSTTYRGAQMLNLAEALYMWVVMNIFFRKAFPFLAHRVHSSLLYIEEPFPLCSAMRIFNAQELI